MTGDMVPATPPPNAANSASIVTVTSSAKAVDQKSAARCTVWIAARLFCIVGP